MGLPGTSKLDTGGMRLKFNHSSSTTLSLLLFVLHSLHSPFRVHYNIKINRINNIFTTVNIASFLLDILSPGLYRY